MKPILMVWADALAATSATPSAAAIAASFRFFMSLLLKEFLLPGPVVHGVLEGRTRLHQAPAQGPLVGVIEALARVGLGRCVEDARDLELPGVEQAARFLDQVARVLARVAVDRIGRARLGAEHRSKRGSVELVPCGFAARRVRFHQYAHAALLRDADP